MSHQSTIYVRQAHTSQEYLTPRRVIRWNVGLDGQTVGTFDESPIFLSVVYDVDFPDGEIKEYAAKCLCLHTTAPTVEILVVQFPKKGSRHRNYQRHS